MPKKAEKSPEEKARTRAKQNANLRPAPPFNELAPEDRQRIAMAGAKASVQARREKKMLREMFAERYKIILSMPMKKGKVTRLEDVECYMDLKDANLEVLDRMTVSVANKALKGDMNAYETIINSEGDSVQYEASPLDALAETIAVYEDPKPKKSRRKKADA